MFDCVVALFLSFGGFCVFLYVKCRLLHVSRVLITGSLDTFHFAWDSVVFIFAPFLLRVLSLLLPIGKNIYNKIYCCCLD